MVRYAILSRTNNIQHKFLFCQNELNTCLYKDKCSALEKSLVYDGGSAIEQTTSLRIVKSCIYGYKSHFQWTGTDEEHTEEQRKYYFYAARTGNINLMRSIYKQNPYMAITRNENDETILLPAVRHADKHTVQYILEFMKFHMILKINERDHKGRNCFLLAAQNGKLETLKYLNSNYPELRNTRDNDGKTALDLAKEQKRTEVVSFFETSDSFGVVTKNTTTNLTQIKIGCGCHLDQNFVTNGLLSRDPRQFLSCLNKLKLRSCSYHRECEKLEKDYQSKRRGKDEKNEFKIKVVLVKFGG